MKNQLRTTYYIISSIVLLTLLTGWNSSPSKTKIGSTVDKVDTSLKPFSIKGDVSKVKYPIKKIVITYYSENKRIRDTSYVKNGNYFFKGKIRDGRTAYLEAFVDNKNKENNNKDNNTYRIYMEPTSMEASSGHVFSDLKLTGSLGQADYVKFQEFMKPFSEAMIKTGIDADKNNFKAQLQYANDHTQSTIIMEILSNIPFKSEFMDGTDGYDADIEQVFYKAPLALQKTEKGVEIENKIAVAIGKQAPDFSLPDMNGNMVSLSSVRGKYVLLDFWASWCGSCRAESPNLIKAVTDYSDDFTVFSVSIDKQKDKQKWLDAIKKDKTNIWPQVLNSEESTTDVPLLYGKIQLLPTTFLLDREGKIIAKNLRGPILEEKLKELMAKTK